MKPEAVNIQICHSAIQVETPESDIQIWDVRGDCSLTTIYVRTKGDHPPDWENVLSVEEVRKGVARIRVQRKERTENG